VKKYMLTEVEFTTSGTPVTRVLATATTTDELRELADVAGDLFETAVVEECKAKHAVAVEKASTEWAEPYVMESKPSPERQAVLNALRRGAMETLLAANG
jgi:hypothetical protein